MSITYKTVEPALLKIKACARQSGYTLSASAPTLAITGHKWGTGFYKDFY